MRTATISLLLVGAVLLGCEGPRAYVNDGDANTVQVTYGGRLETALPVARQWCARFERVPVFLSAESDLAQYNCVQQ